MLGCREGERKVKSLCLVFDINVITGTCPKNTFKNLTEIESRGQECQCTPVFKEWLLNYSNKGLPIAVINCCQRFKCRVCVVIAHTLTFDISHLQMLLSTLLSVSLAIIRPKNPICWTNMIFRIESGFQFQTLIRDTKDKWSFDYILKWKPRAWLSCSTTTKLWL